MARGLTLVGGAMVAIGSAAFSGEPEGARATVLRGRAQGTTYSIKFWGSGDRGAETGAVRTAVEFVLDRVDREMSSYREDSEISRFNRSAAGQWFAVSDETARVVQAALDVNRRTDGAFDVTVGPLVRLWHFGPEEEAASGRGKALRAPTAEEVQAAMAVTGAERLQVRLRPPGLRKEVAGLEVDLSGIAQGYTVDAVVTALVELGVRNALVELGGEVRAIGVRPDGQPWRVGVADPTPGAEGVARATPLVDLAMTTAGDSRRTRLVGGVRYTALVDPRTGAALPYRGGSATVLADTAMEADALDTALMIMGVEAGYQWCSEHNVAALFLSAGKEGSKPVERATPRFLQLAGETSLAEE